MVFYGADVDALRTLAASMERSASTLTGSVGAVDGAVMRATAWKGPAADRFRSQWSSVDRRQITSLASILQDYARRLRVNADAQAQTSAAGTGAGIASSHRSGRPLAPWSIPDLVPTDVVGHIDDAITLVAGAIDTGTVLGSKFLSKLEGLNKVLGPVGLVAGTVHTVTEVQDDVGQHEYVQAAVDGFFGTVGAGLSAAGIVATGTAAGGLGVVSVGVAALAGLVYVSTPLTNDADQSTMNYALQQRFGPSANMNDPTPQEANWISDRYTGPLGVANMISDRMDSTIGAIPRAAGRSFRGLLDKAVANATGAKSA